MADIERHTIAVLVDNEPGILARVVGLFSGRGYNIESLTVAEVDRRNSLSRVTIVTSGTPMIIEQIKAQLSRLVPVHRVHDLTDEGPSVEREMALIKIHAPPASRAEIVALTNVFDATIADVGINTMIVEMTGTPSKVESFIEVIRPFGIKEMMRTGRIAMVRGAHTHQAPVDAGENGNGHVPAKAAALN